MPVRGRPRRFDRQEALRRAMHVFWSKGYDNASLTDLTTAMGINPPSLYAAFGSKEELFKEAVDFYARTEGGAIWDHVAAAPTARQAVELMLRASADAFTRGPKPRGCMIVLAAPQMEGSNEAVSDALKSRRAENVRVLMERLQRAVEEGELPPHTDWRALASYFATVQHGMSIAARDGASRDTLLAVADCAMAAWDKLAISTDSSTSAGTSPDRP